MKSCLLAAVFCMLVSTTWTYRLPHWRSCALTLTYPVVNCHSLRTALLAAKDGKSKKQSKTSEGSTSGTSAAKVPPRVTNKINIPVRQQIMWAKMSKSLIAATSCAASNNVAKKYKKKLTEKPAREEYVEIDYHNTRPPALFVDGYNIVGHMRALGGCDGMDFATVRDSLIGDLAMLQSTTGWWIEAVFDAYKTGFPERQEIVDSILVTYTSPKETADGYIERRFNELGDQGFTNMIVATDDQLLRMGAGTLGKGYLSAELLLEEIRIAYTSWDLFVEEMEEEVQRNKSPSIFVSNETMAIINQFKADYYATLLEKQQEQKERAPELLTDGTVAPRKRLKKRELKLMTQVGQMEAREKERKATTSNSSGPGILQRESEKRQSLGDILDEDVLSFEGDVF